MDQLIPGLAALVEAFRDCFHPQVFTTFQALIAGWIVCTGPRTISEVWQATGLAARRHHDTAYAVFHSAAWEWDDLGIILATLILTHLVPLRDRHFFSDRKRRTLMSLRRRDSTTP